MDQSHTKALSAEAEDALSHPIRRSNLDRRGLWRWIGGIILLIPMMAGFVAAGVFLSRAPANPDAGFLARNQPVFMVVLVLTNLLFIAYAAYQQHQVMATRRSLQKRRLLAILTVARTMGTETNLQNIFDAITDICRRTFECDQVSLMQMDPERETLVVCSASGHRDLTTVLGSQMPVGTGVAGWVAARREPLILGTKINKSQFDGYEPKVDNLCAAMVVPIILRDELFGVLSVSSRNSKVRYDDEDLEALLVFAETAGLCCRHSEQTNWMRQTIQRMDGELMRKDGRSDRRAA